MLATGIYVRVKRDGSWENLLIEELTPEEIEEVLKDYDRDALLRTIIILIRTIQGRPLW